MNLAANATRLAGDRRNDPFDVERIRAHAEAFPVKGQ